MNIRDRGRFSSQVQVQSASVDRFKPACPSTMLKLSLIHISWCPHLVLAGGGAPGRARVCTQLRLDYRRTRFAGPAWCGIGVGVGLFSVFVPAHCRRSAPPGPRQDVYKRQGLFRLNFLVVCVIASHCRVEGCWLATTQSYPGGTT